jgi:hypothetical protein
MEGSAKDQQNRNRKIAAILLAGAALLCAAAFLRSNPDSPRKIRRSASGQGETEPAVRAAVPESVPKLDRESKKQRVRRSLSRLVDFYKSENLDQRLGWTEERKRDPATWGLAFGIYGKPFAEMLQELAREFRAEIWRDTEAFESLLELLRDSSDPDAVRLAVLYAGSISVAGCPRDLEGVSMSWGTGVLQQLSKEQDPRLRILLVRGLQYAGKHAYAESDLIALSQVVQRERVKATMEPALSILAHYISDSQAIREYFLAEVLRTQVEPGDRERQLAAARLLCYMPDQRDDPAVCAAAVGLLRRIDDPKIQRAALDYLLSIRDGKGERPDLSDSNPVAVQYFQQLLETHTRLMASPERTPELEKLRQEIVQKLPYFDMPASAGFLESILRDPAQPNALKSDVLNKIAFSSIYSRESRFDKAESSWLSMLQNVSEDSQLPSPVRVGAYSTLIAFQVRGERLDPEGTVRNIAATLMRMCADSNPEVRKAGELQSRAARDMGILK